MNAGRPLPPTPSTPSFYPHFDKALDLAHRLGVKPTIETMKTLEMAQTEIVRVVRPAYYLELQRIRGGGCGGDLSIERSAKVLKEINKSGCVTTFALITYIEESVFNLLWEMTWNCIIENITVQRSCSRRSIGITNGVFSVDKGENGEGDRAEGKRSSFNAPLKVMISC